MVDERVFRNVVAHCMRPSPPIVPRKDGDTGVEELSRDYSRDLAMKRIRECRGTESLCQGVGGVPQVFPSPPRLGDTGG